MTKKVIKSIIEIAILATFIFFAFQFYNSRNFNNFILSEKNTKTSTFSRDQKEKYINKTSYKIQSPTYNDAMFYETIDVKKDTPYKVTCMVKTKDIESKNNLEGSGAQISVEGTTERSMAISGTSEWQKIEMIFNSKDREKVNVGYRLGGYVDDCKGEAWFADFKIEEGEKEENSTWNFACFIFDNLNANEEGENVNSSLSDSDIINMKSIIRRFEKSAQSMSNEKMSANCDIYRKSTPINKLTYDDEYGYYVAPESIEEQIKEDIATNNYDHIFIIFKLDDDKVKDWIGLGSMDYYGIGYSNIRLSTKNNNYLYKYDAKYNRFPEEVLLHEFLHSLERTLKEYGYNIPALHDNEKYGYKNEVSEGLKSWYEDYMNCTIRSSEGMIGLDPIVYTLKPAKKSDFVNSKTLENAFYEPQNIIQEIVQIYEKVKNNIIAIFNGNR